MTPQISLATSSAALLYVMSISFTTVLGAENGEIQVDQYKRAASDSTVWWTPTTATTTAESVTGQSVTYNQWGFTGSQSIWEPESSSESNSNSHSITHNSTSGANRMRVAGVPDKELGWRSTAMVGGLLGSALALNIL